MAVQLPTNNKINRVYLLALIMLGSGTAACGSKLTLRGASKTQDDARSEPVAPAPPIVSASGEAGDVTPTWSWTSGGGGVGVFRFKLNDPDLSQAAPETSAISFTPETSLAEGQHVLYVQEKSAAGLWSESGNAISTVTAPAAAPTGYAVAISNGEAFTSSAEVSLILTTVGATEMYVTNTAECHTGGTWEAAQSTKTWTLGQANAVASVYVKFRNGDAESDCVSDTIIHDSVAPTAPGTLTVEAYSNLRSSPRLSWVAAGDAGSGIARYEAAIGTAVGGTNIMNWTAVGSTISTTLGSLNLSNGVTYYPSVRAVDNVGLTSAVSTNSSGWVAGIWQQQAYFKATDPELFDHMGSSVSASGDTMVSGAPSKDLVLPDTTAISNAGVAYVFIRSGGVWTQQAQLKSPSPVANDRFGEVVAISGNTIVVGAPGDNNSQTGITHGSTVTQNNLASDAGAAYVFVRDATTWTLQAYLKAPTVTAGDEFGTSISISGETIVIGAPQGSHSSIVRAGSAFVYKRSGALWSLESHLKASNADPNDNFGYAVTIDGDTIAAVSPYESSNPTFGPSNNSHGSSGAVYIFTRNGATWTEQAMLKAANSRPLLYFGTSLSLSGTTLAIGLVSESSNQTTITNGPTASTDTSVLKAGAVYVYVLSGGTWTQQAYIKAPKAVVDQFFASGVSLQGDTLAVGAKFDPSNQTFITNGASASSDTSASQSGAAYIFTRTAGNWSLQAYAKAPNNRAGAAYGGAIALEGDSVFIGSHGEKSSQATITNGTTASSDSSVNESGAVYLIGR